MTLTPSRAGSVRTIAVLLMAAAATLVPAFLGQHDARAAVAADCIAGEYFDGAECVFAERGFYVPTAGEGSQTAIPLGFEGTDPAEGAPAGEGSTGVFECAAGTYRGEALTTFCVPAEVGFFVAAAGALGDPDDRVAIPPGFEGTGGASDGTGSTGTEPCPAGSYRGAAASTFCAAAEVGFFVAAAGASGGPDDRVAIPLGSEGTGGASDGTGSSGVAECDAGSYRGDAATTFCIDAAAGRFVATGGAIGQALCEKGTFQPDTGQTACTPAPAGSHVPVTGSAAAALCPAGTFAASTGADTCTPASVGSYVPRPGSSEQLRCITATQPGLSRCPVPTTAPAAPAPEAPATGDEPLSPQGDECPPGTFSATGTSRAGSTCIPASPGTFVAMPGATAEEPCPPGTYSDGFGASECTVAPVGTFVAGSGAMDPIPCPGATEVGLTICPESLAAPAVEAEPAGSRSVGWWAIGLLLVLGAGGAGFVVLQRRTGGLDGAGSGIPATGDTLTDLPGIDPTLTGASASGGASSTMQPGARTVISPDVLEWDEALDGRIDGDEDTPPPDPRD